MTPSTGSASPPITTSLIFNLDSSPLHRRRRDRRPPDRSLPGLSSSVRTAHREFAIRERTADRLDANVT
ncbi:hypothetical protein [Nonomuraea zeae]|uniref:hypothetical protein n=1 Tax=Nonomuraea zeae TaxID=1642303 RepID=UPI00110AB373|nr:hypothetical protein [Nonomuraea zeae]